jgi:hypothetical protein
MPFSPRRCRLRRAIGRVCRHGWIITPLVRYVGLGTLVRF